MSLNKTSSVCAELYATQQTPSDKLHVARLLPKKKIRRERYAMAQKYVMALGASEQRTKLSTQFMPS
jgi:hypothetical protein